MAPHGLQTPGWQACSITDSRCASQSSNSVIARLWRCLEAKRTDRMPTCRALMAEMEQQSLRSMSAFSSSASTYLRAACTTALQAEGGQPSPLSVSRTLDSPPSRPYNFGNDAQMSALPASSILSSCCSEPRLYGQYVRPFRLPNPLHWHALPSHIRGAIALHGNRKHACIMSR